MILKTFKKIMTHRFEPLNNLKKVYIISLKLINNNTHFETFILYINNA